MDGVFQEMQVSIAASSMFPGFRFSPTDDELISYYLKKKLEGFEKCVEVISEVEICKHEPWDLPAKSVIKSDNEWFYFSARGRKYPNGSQSKRATELGYWKATGKERSVKSGANVIGTKRTLVFHIGRAPKGERTEWIMHEYCMNGHLQDSMVVCRLRKNIDFRLNDTSSQDALGRRHLSTVHNRKYAVSEGGTDETGVSEVDKAVECCPKRCSSSYDSHSIEQIDSASESDQKISNGFTLTGSSSRQKDSDDEEDFYADILKDDIIKLDESSLSDTTDVQPMVAHNPEAEKKSQEPVQAIPLQALPFQGTANRRIRLKRGKLASSHAEAFKALETTNDDYFAEKVKSPNTEESPKCLSTIFSSGTVKQQFVFIVFVILTLLVLFLSLLGGSRKIKRITFATLYRAFWQ